MEEKHYEFEMGGGEKTARYLMYIFDGIFVIAGGSLFTFAMFVEYDKDLADHIGSVGFDRYYNYALVNLSGAILVVLAAFIGWFGTYSSNIPLLFTYVALSAISFVINLTGGIMMLTIGTHHTYAYEFVGDTMLQRMYEYQYSMESKYTVDVVQEYVGCCGAYSWQDWLDIHVPIPDTCRDQVTGNQNRLSCALVLSSGLKTLTGLLSGTAFWICFLQLFTLVFVALIYRCIMERREMAEEDLEEK